MMVCPGVTSSIDIRLLYWMPLLLRDRRTRSASGREGRWGGWRSRSAIGFAQHPSRSQCHARKGVWFWLQPHLSRKPYDCLSRGDGFPSLPLKFFSRAISASRSPRFVVEEGEAPRELCEARSAARPVDDPTPAIPQRALGAPAVTRRHLLVSLLLVLVLHTLSTAAAPGRGSKASSSPGHRLRTGNRQWGVRSKSGLGEGGSGKPLKWTKPEIYHTTPAEEESAQQDPKSLRINNSTTVSSSSSLLSLFRPLGEGGEVGIRRWGFWAGLMYWECSRGRFFSRKCERGGECEHKRVVERGSIAAHT